MRPPPNPNTSQPRPNKPPRHKPAQTCHPNHGDFPVLLRRAWFGINQAFRRRIAHTGSTPDQYTVLRNLHEAGSEGLTQSALTRRMSSDPNTVTALVRRMETAGLIARPVDHADRRARRLRLLPEGENRFQQLRIHAETLLSEILSFVPANERTRFLNQLARVADACRGCSGNGGTGNTSPPTGC